MSSLRLERFSWLAYGPVELEVDAGACTALSGASGSGKSTLLRAIADLDPHEGRVWLSDEACDAMPAPRWRERVRYVASESAWWQPRVREHFRNPDGPELAAGLTRLALPPESLDWDVARCSTGERQRLALLRALESRPEALLLDEPTANLDPTSARAVEELVSAYRRERGAAVLWVAHDAEQARRVATGWLRLEGGKLLDALRGNA